VRFGAVKFNSVSCRQMFMLYWEYMNELALERLQILDYFCDINEPETPYSVANCFNIPVKVKIFLHLILSMADTNAQKYYLNFQLRTSFNNSFT
jgi:hypothetical protein